MPPARGRTATATVTQLRTACVTGLRTSRCVTAKALGLLGVPTIEVLRARLLETAAALPPPLAATPFAPATAAVRALDPAPEVARP